MLCILLLLAVALRNTRLYLAGLCERLPSVSPRAKFSPWYLFAPLPEPGVVHVPLPVVVDLPGRTVARVR
jgi:hypothetical protein